MIEYLLLKIFQRKNSEILIYKILRKIFYKKFARYWFETDKKRDELEFLYWARLGGYKNAIGTFNQPDDYWLNRFRLFHQALNALIVTISANHVNRINVIEVGCGAGQWVKRLKLFDLNISYTGIDINPHSIKAAQNYFEKYTNIKFTCGNIRDVELPDMDILICCQVLFFLDLEAIRLLLRKIPAGSYIVICEPVNSNLYVKTQQFGKCDNQSLESEILAFELNSVGFSHDYYNILIENNFNILQLEAFAGIRILLVGQAN